MSVIERAGRRGRRPGRRLWSLLLLHGHPFVLCGFIVGCWLKWPAAIEPWMLWSALGGLGLLGVMFWHAMGPERLSPPGALSLHPSVWKKMQSFGFSITTAVIPMGIALHLTQDWPLWPFVLAWCVLMMLAAGWSWQHARQARLVIDSEGIRRPGGRGYPWSAVMGLRFRDASGFGIERSWLDVWVPDFASNDPAARRKTRVDLWSIRLDQLAAPQWHAFEAAVRFRNQVPMMFLTGWEADLPDLPELHGSLEQHRWAVMQAAMIGGWTSGVDPMMAEEMLASRRRERVLEGTPFAQEGVERERRLQAEIRLFAENRELGGSLR